MKPFAHNSTLCYVENPNETELQNLGEGEVSKIRNSHSFKVVRTIYGVGATLAILYALFDYIY
ncbi:MAG: hypothetical protein KAX72_05445 [Chitinophagales bacterium]|nr:hypothetical protein [Chitinophagales bacterium]